MTYYVQYTFLGKRYASRTEAKSPSEAKSNIKAMYIKGDRSGVKFTSTKKLVNPSKAKDYRIYTSTDGYGTHYSEYYTKTDAIKTARTLAREYPESEFQVYQQDTDKVVWKKKARNPGVPKGKFIKCKAVKFNKNGSISIKK